MNRRPPKLHSLRPLLTAPLLFLLVPACFESSAGEGGTGTGRYQPFERPTGGCAEVPGWKTCGSGCCGAAAACCDQGAFCALECSASKNPPSGGDESTPCAEDEILVEGLCRPTCGSHDQCETGCCATADEGRYRVCGPAEYCGNEQAGPSSCLDRTSCIEVVSALAGTRCDDPTSLSVTSRNNCSESIMIQTCIERSNGSWDCGLDSSVPPGGNMSYWSCDTSNRYILSGHHPDDWGKAGCVEQP